MAGHDSGTQYNFTGIQKYFNSYTMTGRRNCVLATYAGIAMIFLYFKLKPKKQTKAVTEK
ncbi:ATP synthase F(0) complex subunit k, mitochondrial [Microcaecilia unicolor]|uniref:ATP synthase membrane subunit DAPIT, mitochondrial n=1 Tax=Microcaecilia unicolor TaxID=1415580 RepID=A0A6P7Y1G4_9AMPH|nr:ATP synthase membrane subunit DAPIT, mitochondrial [Microcaecilia unicolor]